MACAAWCRHWQPKPGAAPSPSRRSPGFLTAEEHADGTISVDMGVRASAGTRSRLAEEFADTRMIELQVGPIDCAGAAFAFGRLHGQSPRDLLGRWRRLVLRSGAVRPAAGKPSDLSRKSEHFDRPDHFSDGAHIAYLGTRLPDWTLRLRNRGLRSGGFGRAYRAHRAEGITVTVPGGDLHISWRDDDHVIMTGARPEWEFFGHARSRDRRLAPRCRGRGLMAVEIVTFGCRLNAYESEVMRGEAEKAGLGTLDGGRHRWSTPAR